MYLTKRDEEGTWIANRKGDSLEIVTFSVDTDAEYIRLHVPKEINGFEVRSIGHNFANITSMDDTEMKKSKKVLRDKLVKVILPKTVAYIERRAFRGCRNLTDIYMYADQMVRVSEGAFEDCYKLKKVEMPGYLQILDPRAFRNCYGLEEIEIPEGVELLCTGLFENCFRLESVDISKDVRCVSHQAFKGCKSLRDLKISKYLWLIKERAFEDCVSLEKVDLTNTHMTLSSLAFLECTGLKEVKFGGRLDVIPSYAFAGCKSLTKVRITKNIRKLGKGCFDGCWALSLVEVEEERDIFGEFAKEYMMGIYDKEGPTLEVDSEAFSNWADIEFRRV